MKITKMNESAKAAVTGSFLATLVSRYWDSVSEINELIKMLQREYAGADDIASMLQSLADAYLICIGGLERRIGEQGDLGASGATVDEALQESRDETLADLLKDEKEAVDGYNKAIDSLKDCAADAEVATLRHIEDEELEHIEELSELIKADDEPEQSAPADEFNCEFDEPVGKALTDADLYQD